MKVLIMGMFKFHSLFSNILFRNLSIVFIESIATKGLSFLSILILSRTLGPEDYGKYSFLFVSIAFLSAFFDFGMENTAVRFTAREKGKTNSIFGIYLFIKIIMSVLVIVVMLIFGDKIFHLLGKTDLYEFLPYLVLGFIGESLFFINDTFLQARQKFKLRAIINISRYFILVIAIVILKYNQMLLLKYVVYIYFIPLFISFGFFFQYYNILKIFFKNYLSKGLLKELFHYEKWMFLIAIPNNTLGRIDFFLISLWVTYEQIGIYNAAFQLTAIVSFIPFAFGKVLLPKMSELSEQEVILTTKKIGKPVLIISMAMVCLVPFVHPIVPLLLGKEYIDAVNILIVMLISAALAFAIVPLEQAFYSIGKPMYITIGKYLQITAIIGLIFLFVPYFGVIWAAISVLLARLLYGGVLLKLYVNYKEEILQVKRNTMS
jgi:O-antigen/teichoic acid export membrane protein